MIAPLSSFCPATPATLKSNLLQAETLFIKAGSSILDLKISSIEYLGSAFAFKAKFVDKIIGIVAINFVVDSIITKGKDLVLRAN